MKNFRNTSFNLIGTEKKNIILLVSVGAVIIALVILIIALKGCFDTSSDTESTVPIEIPVTVKDDSDAVDPENTEFESTSGVDVSAENLNHVNGRPMGLMCQNGKENRLADS
jgi:hypothetical protein